MPYSAFGKTAEAQLKKAEAILQAQIRAATKIASAPPFASPGNSANPEVIAALVNALALNYGNRLAAADHA